MPKIKVIDLSHHNTIPESLEPAYDAGVRGVIHKCTEGTGYIDDDVDARFYLADQARMLWGLYHFLRPGDMQRQAEFFWQSAQKVSDENTLFAADHEDRGVSLSDLIEFLEAIAELSGREPVIYSGNVLKEQLSSANSQVSKYRLWLAQYGSTPSMPAGFESYYLWQYSDGEAGPNPHTVPGVKSPVDCNDFEGSDGELRATWAGRKWKPKPPRPPKPDEGGTITIKIPKETIEITLALPGKKGG